MALGAVLPDGFVDLFHGGFDEGDAVEKDGGGLLVSNNAINSEPLLSPRPTEIATSFYQ